MRLRDGGANPMRISVLITSYNQIDFLAEAVESALQQTEPVFEIIISDDCSTDGSQRLIHEFQRGHPETIRVFMHERNMGIPRNKSFAIGQAGGDWIMILDGDDRLRPEKIAATRRTVKVYPHARVIFGNHAYVDKNGAQFGVWATDDQPEPPSGWALKEVFAKSYPDNSLFRNEVVHLASLDEIGYYDPEMMIYEDWELRIRLANRYQLAYGDEILSEYRRHEGGISQIDPDVHTKYIRLLFNKNRALLEPLPAEERLDTIRKFLKNEKVFSRMAIWQCLTSGRLKQALKTGTDSRKFHVSCLAL